MQSGSSSESHSASTPQEPLLFLSDSSVAIFPDKLVQYPKNINKLTSVTTATLPSINDLEAPQKIIKFGKNDVAFRICQKDKRVSIIKIRRGNTEMDFIVQKPQQMILVQEVLRKKLCELGFHQKYDIRGQLGKGATAKVYLVTRKSDNKKFAAKIISLTTSQNKEYQSFINQTKLLRYMKNRYIVHLESLYISKKELICVLEYLEGGTLLDQLRNDGLKTSFEKFKAVKDITQGLEHMRQKRIVHRDLKLENILIRINEDKSKDYVITDFGLATWIGEKQLIYEKCGTPGYIAPEILRATKSKVIVAHSSDIFSLGVIYHFIMLTRAVFPFNGNPKQLLMYNKKAVIDLNTRHHQSLLTAQLNLLEVTLTLDLDKRASSRQLLDIHIREYQKDLESMKKKKVKGGRKNQLISAEPSSRVSRFRESKSIETIERRAPSFDKNQFSSRTATQPKEKEQPTKQKQQSSVGKVFNKIWNRISPAKSQGMKKKEEASTRKTQMKSFLF